MDLHHVGVFCASSDSVDDVYLSAAAELGHCIATRGWTTLYGGGGTGLMGALARAVLKHRTRIIGVRPSFISDFEADQLGLDEMIPTQSMHERIAIMFGLSSAFAILPGACGTLDELMQAVTWKRLGLHNKPIVIINTLGFFDPMLAMFQRLTEHGFINNNFHGLYEVHENAASAVESIANHKPQAAAVI